MESIEKRFVLIADNGDRLYPYKKLQKKTGRYGFALARPGEQDRHGQGTYTESIQEVIKRLVFDGWSVRAKTIDKSGVQREGTFGIGKRSIRGYEVAKEFEYLITTATAKPISLLPSQVYECDTFSAQSLGRKLKASPIDEMTSRSIKSRRGQPEFRSALLLAFGGRCCISGCEVESVLEAAHVVPHTEETNYSVENGILLRADIHTLYDLNIIGVDGDGKVVVSDELKESEYWRFNGKCIAEHISETMSSNLRRRFSMYGLSDRTSPPLCCGFVTGDGERYLLPTSVRQLKSRN